MDPVRNSDVAVGRAVRWRRVVTQADFDRFARLSGDDNPIHVDAAFAAGTRFRGTLAHGMMLMSFIAHVVRRLLVPGGVELRHELIFPGPVFAGDEIMIDARVASIAAGEVEVVTQLWRRAPPGALGVPDVMDATDPDASTIGCQARSVVLADV
jgi:3-hydroxybutyryl-CoA dehydratase